jgi:hypothetical protein
MDFQTGKADLLFAVAVCMAYWWKNYSKVNLNIIFLDAGLILNGTPAQ